MNSSLRVARFGLCAMLVWAPLPLGSNRPLFWVVNACIAGLLTALFLLGKSWREPSEQDSPVTAVLVCGLLVILVWMLLQAAPISGEMLSHPLRSSLGAGFGPHGSISANPAGTWTTVAQVAPPNLLAILAAYLSARRGYARLLLDTFVFSATALAIYGLSGQYLGFDQVWLIDSDAYEGSVTATFVSRNSAATYFAMALVSVCAIVGESLNPAGRSARHHIPASEAILHLLITRGVYLIAIAILLSALLNTGSRAGVAAGLVGTLCVAVSALRPLRPGRRLRAAVFLLLGSIALAGVFVVSSNFLFKRLATADVAADARFDLYRDTIRMILDRPLLGHGAGVFADVYPFYQSASVPAYVVWERAHDTYLQTAAELGLPMTLLLLSIGAVAFYRICKGLAARRGAAPLSLAAMGMFVVVGQHSLIDFSLQIQAVGIVFAVMAGAGFGESFRLLQEGRDEPAERTNTEKRLSPSNTFETVYVDIPQAPKPDA